MALDEWMNADAQMREDRVRAQVGEAGNLAKAPGGAVQGATTNYRPSAADVHEKNAAYHLEQAAKAKRAEEFFRAFPQFETFMDLIRSGAIHF